MARLARVTMSMGPYVAHNKSIQLTILGVPVRFVSESFTGVGGTTVYFAQNQTPDVLAGDVGRNVAALETAVKAYLQSIGETRFSVIGAVVTGGVGFEQGGSVTLRAKEYRDELNLPYALPDSGDNYVTASGCTNNPPQTASFLKTDVSCYGSTSGDIFLNVAGGVAPYAYQWEDGPTTKDREMVIKGVYRVTIADSTVPDALGDDHPGVVSLEITLGEPTRVEVVASVQGQSVTVEVSGGTPGYTYTWSDGSTEKDRSGLAPGTYRLTVTDANGCSSSVNVVVSNFRFYFSRNPVTLELAAEDVANKPNLSFLCELWVEKAYLSGEFEKVTSEPLEHPADVLGTTLFDLRELLDAYVEPHLPELSAKSVVRADAVFRRFFLKYTEKYGSPAAVAPYTQIDTQYVLCGGLDTQETLAGTFFSSYLPNRKPFFTWDQPEKGVYTNQPEFLYFMPNSFLLESFTVKTKVRFSDGTSLITDAYMQTEVRRYEMYCIPVGHDQIGVGVLKENVSVKSWDVYLVDQDGAVISETRRFFLLPDLDERRRYLLYTNSLGGINTLVTTGKAKLKLDPDTTTLERNLLPGTPATRHEVEVRSKSAKATLELTTGYREPREILALQDFLLAERVWLLENDRFTPVLVLDKNQVPLDEAEDVGYLDFEVQLPRRHRYTPQLRLAGYYDQTSELKPLEL
ncbi:SprB repeat-containing protein [Rufibacter hautae]|uniref:PKD domain-containing protein n=1 Tax=Rufibacter hautae TaxID=2595005 RepID=A0A5B6TSU7_9BACT|nr:SprB repeat-containing protein [Rufibacter hautae]KAA3439568.1 hypothetical protein FOA19_02465 [Rufibacter hautae]